MLDLIDALLESRAVAAQMEGGTGRDGKGSGGDIDGGKEVAILSALCVSCQILPFPSMLMFPSYDSQTLL